MSDGVTKTIVVIDDDAPLVEALAQSLRKEGSQRVLGATTVLEAFRILATEHVDLAVCNYVMPGMDGINLIKQARSRLPDLAVIYLTSHLMATQTAEAQGVQALGLLLKPVKVDEVRGLIDRHFHKSAPAPADAHEKGDAGIAAQLDQFQLVDIIQMCCQSKRTAKLSISHGESRGEVYFENGNIIHAECEGLRGTDGLYRVMAWDYGKFELDERATMPPRSIHQPWDSLVMEGARRKDERHAAEVKVEPGETLVGTTIGSYRIQRELGEGTWGRVYLAVQEGIGRTVALKVLSHAKLNDPLAVEQFLSSASLMANLQHANIVTVYEAGEANGLIYYAMEYVKGASWEQLQKAGEKFTVSQAVLVMKSIARALSYLEARKVERRAITPRQVLVETTGDAKLCDFGLHEGVAISSGLEDDFLILGREMMKSVKSFSAAPSAFQRLARRLAGEEKQVPYLSIDSLIEDLNSCEHAMTQSVPKVVVPKVAVAAPSVAPTPTPSASAPQPAVAAPKVVVAPKVAAPAVTPAEPKIVAAPKVAAPAPVPEVVAKPAVAAPPPPTPAVATPKPAVAAPQPVVAKAPTPSAPKVAAPAPSVPPTPSVPSKPTPVATPTPKPAVAPATPTPTPMAAPRLAAAVPAPSVAPKVAAPSPSPSVAPKPAVAAPSKPVSAPTPAAGAKVVSAAKPAAVAGPKVVAAPKAVATKPKVHISKQYIAMGVAAFFLLDFIGLGVWWLVKRPGKIKDINDYCEVAAGEFKYGEKNETRATRKFYVSKYEVTIGQYRKFLEAVAVEGSDKYRHPDQPATKDHYPQSWKQMQEALKSGKGFTGVKITDYSPIFNIDWFDAYAYSKWAGGRLPTEEEWEKAARGADGNRYPWGNSFDSQRCNSGDDWTGVIEDSGEKDGHAMWAPQSAMPGDVSPFGARHMAGNVSEWTGDLVPHSQYPDTKVALVRGGSFMLKEFDLTYRFTNILPRKQEFWIGFRVVWDNPPTKER